MNESNSVRNERIFYLIVWTIFAILPIILELWKLINNSEFMWSHVVRWWVGMLPLIALFFIHNGLLIPKLMKKGKLKTYCLALAGIIVIYGAIQYAALPPRPNFASGMGPSMRPPMPIPPMDMPPRPFPRLIPLPVIFKLMLAIMMVGVNVAISLIFTYHREQAKRKELENSRLQEELKYLKQQISPHFLMNVLNNIHAMAEDDIKTAQEMILELSCLLRYALYESENEMTTLASEKQFITSYIALMKRRYFEDIVDVRVDIQENMTADIRIPQLLFISFIENAFKHGVSYNNNTVINITLSEELGNIVFTCENTIPQKKDNKVIGGVGLSNVRRRLDLLYGDEYTLCIDNNDTVYSVRLIIPCR